MKVFVLVLSKPNRRNKHGGTSLAEFAPALIVLLIFIFFPVLDLLTVCFDYAVLMVLNYNQIHEAALIPSEQANDPVGVVKKGVVDQWQKGMGNFVKLSGSPQTTVSYADGSQRDDKTLDKVVTITTNIDCNPFVPVPVPGLTVPGLNAPMTLSVTTQRPMEDPDNAAP